MLRLLRNHCVPIDVHLDVPGVPQSATGQTALLTGVNAPSLVGAHVEGFPNAPLRRILEQDNVFTKLLARGQACTFANAYILARGPHLPLAFRSATTVSTLAAFGTTRNREELLAGRAVYHDLTRHTLAERGINGIPVICEEEAATHLLAIARSVRFCLFEYFLTDHVGHRGTDADKRSVLASLDRFLQHLLAGLDAERELLLLVSDHGNIEATDRRGHSHNPVPWLAVGCAAERALSDCSSLLDVTPKILELLAPCRPELETEQTCLQCMAKGDTEH